MKKEIFESHSQSETIKIARRFAKNLSAGSVVTLDGNLGSGKTTFLKGVALGLGLRNPDHVKSPTFAVMHVYETKPPIYHFDLYRLETIKEVRAIGFEDFLNEGTAVSCIEWPERASILLPREFFNVRIEITGENSRKITLQSKAALKPNLKSKSKRTVR